MTDLPTHDEFVAGLFLEMCERFTFKRRASCLRPSVEWLDSLSEFLDQRCRQWTEITGQPIAVCLTSAPAVTNHAGILLSVDPPLSEPFPSGYVDPPHDRRFLLLPYAEPR